jgi:hypothetical protein
MTHLLHSLQEPQAGLVVYQSQEREEKVPAAMEFEQFKLWVWIWEKAVAQDN